jgi:hypothetical protein
MRYIYNNYIFILIFIYYLSTKLYKKVDFNSLLAYR